MNNRAASKYSNPREMQPIEEYELEFNVRII